MAIPITQSFILPPPERYETRERESTGG
jgi:hypothetical protein